MSYKALYRIYRPKDFNEVAGQTHITTTLKNALANDKVAHAYLFSGPRGTGKTSIAKIFAKAVNCVHAPIDNPCNVCENCKGIQSGVISDIIEIDAASNNGVDEIREIRDKVKYLPGYVKYKVYIIDEVHMLSIGAFNALLKTLEEPPAHVIFILCTTEPQKIPLTIHSRCQRFDFKAISTKDIIGKLNEIIDNENINIDIEAISQIAIHAEGGLRDAISLLDQARAYSPKYITANDVEQISGAVSNEMQIKLAEVLIQGDSTKAIELLNELITEGKEVRKININLIEFFRDILMMKNLRKLDESNFLYKNERFIQLSKSISNQKTFYILDILNKATNDIKWSNNPKIYLELAFIKLTDDETDSNIKIINILDDIENRLSKVEKFKDEVVNNDQKIVKNRNLEIDNKDDKIEEKDILKNVEIEEEIIKKTDEFIDYQKNINKEFSNNLDNTYSIKFIESVLNNGNRNDKSTLIDAWNKLSKSAETDEEKQIAKILDSGKIVASSVNKIIITFPSTSICNKLMTPISKESAISVLSKTFNRDIDFIALPEVVFDEVVSEFRKLWKKGQRNVKLSKIKCDGLEDVSILNDEKIKVVKPKIITDAIELFGDIVEIKK